jgi:hypothetical protein
VGLFVFLVLPRRPPPPPPPPPPGTELERLAREVLAAARDRPPPGPGVPDAYQYTLTVDDEPPVEFTDPGLTGAELRLVERLLGEGA